MTYCVGLLLDEGLVMLSDTRTNAGVDHISTYRKMKIWEVPDERVLILMSAGNLSISQTVVNLLNEGIEDADGETETLMNVGSMFKAAQLVGQAVQRVRHMYGNALEAENSGFNVSLILGGQIKGRSLRLFHIYPEGNFIEAGKSTPFFQIGETKYGKPILDRVLHRSTTLADGMKLALISMDSTLRSNISVGLPLHLSLYERDSLKLALERTVEEGDAYFEILRTTWSKALQDAYRALPDPDWQSPTLFDHADGNS